MEKGGQDGAITVEEGKTIDTVLNVVEVMRVERSYAGVPFITDQDPMECVLKNVLVSVSPAPKRLSIGSNCLLQEFFLLQVPALINADRQPIQIPKFF